MPTVILILLIYLILNLAMLAFRPVRLAWKELLSIFKEELVERNLWREVFVLPGTNPPWWEKMGCALLFAILYLLFFIVLVLMMLFPFYTYYNAIRNRKRLLLMAEISANYIPDCSEWGANTDQNHIEFDNDLPFTPSMYEVFYVEDQYNPAVNDYILQHYDELCKSFLSHRLTFNYLPAVSKQVVQEEVLRYLYPYMERFDAVENGEITVDNLRSHLVSGDFVGPALIHYKHDGTDSPEKYYFSYIPLVPDSSVPLPKQFEWYVKNVSFEKNRHQEGAMAHPGSVEGDDKADFCFHNECFDPFTASTEWDLIDEIRERVFALRKRGLQLHWIQEMIEMPPKLSHLVVDKEFRIFLPDYNNMEITMSPLPKAVFLLFLKHPEGIPFKLLNDYYPELLDIYKQISNRVLEATIEKSIRDITDPSKNSINEKCARIREAFISKFDTFYAQHYYVTGKRGEPKKITLPRELVDLQAL